MSEQFIKILLVGFSAILGAVLGSFSCCQAWRIRYKETGKKDPGKRSVCLHCGKKLTWYENIPILSWILQRGKCRKCGKKIGSAEIISEVLGAISFGILGWKLSEELFSGRGFEPLLFIEAGIVVIFTTIMLILAVYDAKWRELPTKLLVTTVVLGAIYACIKILFRGQDILSLMEAVGILAGIYYILYIVSKEKLVGGGDWILGLSISLFVGEWWLAIWVLFLSNFSGAIVMLPQRKKKIAFGPFLVGAFIVVFAFSDFFLSLI